MVSAVSVTARAQDAEKKFGREPVPVVGLKAQLIFSSGCDQEPGSKVIAARSGRRWFVFWLRSDFRRSSCAEHRLL